MIDTIMTIIYLVGKFIIGLVIIVLLISIVLGAEAEYEESINRDSNDNS